MVFARWPLLFLFLVTAIFGSILQAEGKTSYGASATLTTSSGLGNLLEDSTNPPGISSNIDLAGTVTPAKMGDFPKFSLNARLGMSSGWFQSYEETRKFSLSDLATTLKFPGILKTDYGLSFTPALRVKMPTSNSSRSAKKILNYRIATKLGFSKWGFGIGYRPAFSQNLYAFPVNTVPCGSNKSPIVSRSSGKGFEFEQGDLPSFVGNDNEIYATGICMKSGRQTLFNFDNLVTMSWSKGGHTFYLATGWLFSYLRPLEEHEDERSPYAQLSSIKENTYADFGYAYDVPVEKFSLSLSLGLSTFQSAFTKQGNFRFPFIDILNTADNASELYFDVTIGV